MNMKTLLSLACVGKVNYRGSVVYGKAQSRKLFMTHLVIRSFSVVVVAVMAAVSAHAELWTPAEVSNWGWYDAADSATVLASGTSVTNFLDKSGNGRHLVQATASKRPQTGVRVFNGLNVLDCDQSLDQAMYLPGGASGQPANTIAIAVVSHDTDFGNQDGFVTFQDRFGLNVDEIYAGSGKSVGVADSNVSFGRTLMGANITAGILNYDASVSLPLSYVRGYTNGVQAGSDVAYNLLFPSGGAFSIMTENNQAATLEGAFAEAIITDGDNSTETRQKLEGYLAHKWGLADKLPSGHPYASEPPIIPGTIAFWDVASSDVTATEAVLSATVNSNLTSATVVWDTSDKGNTNLLVWAGSNSASGSTPGTISGTATNLTSDTVYFFRFYGEDGTTNGWSWARTFASGLTAAQTPAFTAATSTWNSVTLEWSDIAATETGYVLQRSTNGTTYSQIAALDKDTTRYVDGAVVYGTTYYYRLAATNSVNASGTDPSACQTNATPALTGNMIFGENFEDPVIDGAVDTVPPNWIVEPAPAGGGSVNDLPSLADGAVTGKTGDQYLSLPRYNYGMTTKTNVGLTNALQPHVNYTLTCDISASTDQNLMYVELRAGTNVLMVKTNVAQAITTGDLSANRISMSFLALPDNPYIGEVIGVRLFVTYDAYHAGRWYFDNVALYATPTTNDHTAPTPTTMAWVDLPTSSVSNSITMMATNAVDANGVQYIFTNTVNGNVSGWQESPIWRDTGLTPGVTYSYKVKARDKSVNLNETAWSPEKSAECEPYIILYESFEEPSILLRPATVLSFGLWPLPPDGWDYVKVNSLDVWRDSAGVVSTPFGEQYVAMRAANQILATLGGHVLAADYTYRVTFNAGGMDGAASAAKPVSSLVELIAGSTVVASNTISVTTADLSETCQLEFIPDAAHTHLGETLKIKLTVTTTPSGWNDRGQFDNVKVYAIPPPPQGTVIIFR